MCARRVFSINIIFFCSLLLPKSSSYGGTTQILMGAIRSNISANALATMFLNVAREEPMPTFIQISLSLQLATECHHPPKRMRFKIFGITNGPNLSPQLVNLSSSSFWGSPAPTPFAFIGQINVQKLYNAVPKCMSIKFSGQVSSLTRRSGEEEQ